METYIKICIHSHCLTPPSLMGYSRCMERWGALVLDRSLVTLIALGRLIETIGVKRTLERLLIKEPIIMSTWKEHLLRFIPCTSNLM